MITVKNISKQMVILNTKNDEAIYFTPRKKEGSIKQIDEENVIKSEFDYYVKNKVLKIQKNNEESENYVVE